MEITFDAQHEPISARIPFLLFRYHRANENLLSSLKEAYLWFSPPSALNDPLDCRNILDSENTFQDIKLYLSKFGKLNKRQAKLLAKQIAVDGSIAREWNEKIYALRIAPVNLCCFSVRHDIRLMWAHYADGHRGVCLAFAAPILFHQESFSMIKVMYSEESPKYNVVRELLTFGESAEYHFRFDQIVLGTKTNEWAYEKEVRLISHQKGKNAFTSLALAGVILGHKMASDDIVRISEIMRNNYPNAFVLSEELDSLTGQVKVTGLSDPEQHQFEVEAAGWRRLESLTPPVAK